MSLCNVLFLFCATMNFNYCCLLMYIIYMLFDIVSWIDPVGLYIQDSIFNAPMPPYYTLQAFILELVYLVFEMIAIYFAF